MKKEKCDPKTVCYKLQVSSDFHGTSIVKVCKDCGNLFGVVDIDDLLDEENQDLLEKIYNLIKQH